MYVVAQSIFCKNEWKNFAEEKRRTKIWATSANYQKSVESIHLPIRRKFAQSGVDVMITIFCEKMAFFLKTNVIINILHNLALF
jgi:hypothetical protein